MYGYGHEYGSTRMDTDYVSTLCSIFYLVGSAEEESIIGLFVSVEFPRIPHLVSAFSLLFGERTSLAPRRPAESPQAPPGPSVVPFCKKVKTD